MSAKRPLECLVVGAPGAGKTLFALSLIEAMGSGDQEVRIYHEDARGRVTHRNWRLADAKAKLVGAEPGTTRGLQWATVELPLGVARGRRALTIVDSTGITEQVAQSSEVQAGIAQTLDILRRASLVIHLVSTADGGPGPVDRLLTEYCSELPQGRYLPVWSKADLGSAAGKGNGKLGLADGVPFSAYRRRDLHGVLRRLRRWVQGVDDAG